MSKSRNNNVAKKELDDIEIPIKTKFYSLLSEIFDVSGKKGYKKFLFFLIMIDLTWFASVMSDNLFNMNLQDYGEFAWIFLFSLGLIMVSDLKKLTNVRKKGLKSDIFASLVTFTIGVMALVVAIFSLPNIAIDSPTIRSVKGIIAMIAIIYVFLETWVVEES